MTNYLYLSQGRESRDNSLTINSSSGATTLMLPTKLVFGRKRDTASLFKPRVLIFCRQYIKNPNLQNSIHGEARNLVEESETFGRGVLESTGSGNTFRPGARLSSDSLSRKVSVIWTLIVILRAYEVFVQSQFLNNLIANKLLELGVLIQHISRNLCFGNSGGCPRNPVGTRRHKLVISQMLKGILRACSEPDERNFSISRNLLGRNGLLSYW